MLDDVSIQCADMPASRAFYDAVLATIGGTFVRDPDGNVKAVCHRPE